MDLRLIERRIIVASRFLTVSAVLGSLAASMLMFFLGLYNIYEAFRYGLQQSAADESPFGTAAVISVIEGLDRFLIAIVLLYFAYGVYSLFIHPEAAEEELALPAWLRIRKIGQLKQVVAEVILVILLVLFLRVALESYRQPGVAMTWPAIVTFLLLPVSTMLLAIALRVVELHPKPRRSTTTGSRDEKPLPRKDEESSSAPPPSKSNDGDGT